jgi:hypothetical protein
MATECSSLRIMEFHDIVYVLVTVVKCSSRLHVMHRPKDTVTVTCTAMSTDRMILVEKRLLVVLPDNTQ